MNVAETLGQDGPFIEALPGFAPRQMQIDLAEAIEQAIDQQNTLVAEAGTGIGKTFAYLVPALLSGQRIVISTGTKTLQDQLFFRDLPLVQQALEVQPRSALLKGRSNYLCLYRMQQTRDHGQLRGLELVAELSEVYSWSGQTVDGDLSTTAVVREDSPLRPLITSTTDNCLGAECPLYAECFVMRARQQAQEAQVVIVNHHLLFADMALKEQGFGEVLPGADVFIVDEAHQVPEIASTFFSGHLSSRQLQELFADLLMEAGTVAGGAGLVSEGITAARQALERLVLAFHQLKNERGVVENLLGNSQIMEAFDDLQQCFQSLLEQAGSLQGTSKTLDACLERAQSLLSSFAYLSTEPDGHVVWYERRSRGFILHATPLDVAESIAAFREKTPAAWVFTSATLSVNQSFDHFSRQTGLQQPSEFIAASPFDYPRHALLWAPEALPEPRSAEFIPLLLEALIPVLEASKGRAFLLFTSHRALRIAADLLRESVEYPLFIQGQAPRSQLLEEFRVSGNGILLGAASFWEGVDVAGAALSLVVIDKLPFAAPDDPVLEARCRILREAGENPFFTYQIPQAVIALKQGAGRLIRDVNDRGVLVIGDPRLLTKRYGWDFINSLPPMRRTRKQTRVLQFFEHEHFHV